MKKFPKDADRTRDVTEGQGLADGPDGRTLVACKPEGESLATA